MSYLRSPDREMPKGRCGRAKGVCRSRVRVAHECRYAYTQRAQGSRTDTAGGARRSETGLGIVEAVKTVVPSVSTFAESESARAAGLLEFAQFVVNADLSLKLRCLGWELKRRSDENSPCRFNSPQGPLQPTATAAPRIELSYAMSSRIASLRPVIWSRNP